MENRAKQTRADLPHTFAEDAPLLELSHQQHQRRRHQRRALVEGQVHQDADELVDLAHAAAAVSLARAALATLGRLSGSKKNRSHTHTRPKIKATDRTQRN